MEGRLEDYRWAGHYIASRQVVAVNKSSGIYKLSDLKGKNLAVQSTTKPEGIFLKRTDERIPELEDLNSLGHRELIYTFLRKGYVDAVAAHEESVIQYIKVIPIIAMTANAFTEDRLRSKEVGMDEHIAKPVDVKLLMRVISELVENNSGRGSRIEKENME